MSAVRQILRTSKPVFTQSRALSTSVLRANKDVGPDRTHHLDKKDGLDPQQAAAKHSKDERAQGGADSNSQATSRRDQHGSNKKIKEEFPNAPEPVIGMNSERGPKGH